MKSIIFSLICTLFFTTTCQAGPDIDNLIPSIVKVSFKTHSATGFLISNDGYILTCAHVFNDYNASQNANDISVRFYEPDQIAYNVPLAFLKKSKEKEGGGPSSTNLREIYSECALLKVPASQISNRPPLKFASPDARGAPAYFCAVGAHEAPRLTKRTIVATNPIFFLLSPTVFPGDSGSPVLNANGEVTGVLLLQHTTHWGGAVTAPHVKSLLPPAYSKKLSGLD